MALTEIILTAFWAMLPAYIPNNAAVIFGGGKPVDMGRNWRGNRILGDGKTWRGSIGGIAAGVVVALILNAILPQAQKLTGAEFASFPFLVVLLLPTGAILGDIAASFIKRRLDRERGAPFPGVDQLDFVAGSLGLLFIFEGSWASSVFTPQVLAVVLIITPVLHLGTNFIGFRLGLKDEPW